MQQIGGCFRPPSDCTSAQRLVFGLQFVEKIRRVYFTHWWKARGRDSLRKLNGIGWRQDNGNRISQESKLRAVPRIGKILVG